LPVPIANKWSQGVLEEFQLVHQAEKDAGVDLTPFIIGLDDPLRAANCQFGFINFIVKPLWTNLSKIVTEDMATELIGNLHGNIDYWKNQVDVNTPTELNMESDVADDAEKHEEKSEKKSEEKNEGKNEGNSKGKSEEKEGKKAEEKGEEDQVMISVEKDEQPVTEKDATNADPVVEEE